jgi:hypothetical protein
MDCKGIIAIVTPSIMTPGWNAGKRVQRQTNAAAVKRT